MQRVGRIIDHRKDPNSSTGDHLDVKINRLYGDKGPVDPSSKPGLLKRIRFGDDRHGLDQYPITSGYQPEGRTLGGVTKPHYGIDYGIGAGTQIYWDGEGRYSPENSIGVIYTKDDAGNPYEVLLTHTELGGASPGQTNLASTNNIDGTGAAPALPASAESAADPVVGAAAAKERAQNYAQMSAAELNTAYDAMRSDTEVAEVEGMKMHNAFFNKP